MAFERDGDGRISNSHQLSDTHLSITCPACRWVFEGYRAKAQKVLIEPRNGDGGVCPECGAIMTWEGGAMRVATPEEEATYMKHEVFRETVTFIKLRQTSINARNN